MISIELFEIHVIVFIVKVQNVHVIYFQFVTKLQNYKVNFAHLIFPITRIFHVPKVKKGKTEK